MLVKLFEPASLLFIGTVLITLLIFGYALKSATLSSVKYHSNKIIIGLLVWLFVQAVLSFNGIYYASVDSIPPKIVLFGILPMFLCAIIGAFSKFGDSLPLKTLTYLHVVRLPVEIVLYLLYLNGSVPGLMTFAGWNFDVISGVTAPFVAYYIGKRNAKFLLAWNFICLALLIVIVAIAFFSAPSPLQKLAFDQPNIAILYFPFSWLPTFVVPLVLFSHLVSIRRILIRN